MCYFPIIYCITHTYNHLYIAGIGDVIVSFIWRRVSFQTHYLIIAETYQRDDVRERDRHRDHFQTVTFSSRQLSQWNESGFRPPLSTYRQNWARRTSWGWWDEWDDTVLQTLDSKFEPWRSEAEHATSRSRRLPTILTFTRGWGKNHFLFLSNRRDRELSPELWHERQRC